MKKALLLLIFSGLAHAEFKDGNRLLRDLKEDDYFSKGYAMGYIIGVADMGMGIIHCPPANVTAGQLKDMVQNYLENTPAERHQSGDLIINRILKTMWPCAKKGTAL